MFDAALVVNEVTGDGIAYTGPKTCVAALETCGQSNKDPIYLPNHYMYDLTISTDGRPMREVQRRQSKQEVSQLLGLKRGRAKDSRETFVVSKACSSLVYK